MTTTNREWDRADVRRFVKSAKAKFGKDGWALLVPAVQRCVIEAEACRVLTAQASATIPVKAAALLVGDMLREAALADKDTDR